MSENTQSVSLPKKNTQQFFKLTLTDEITNIEYVVELDANNYNRAHNDIKYATMLLNKAKSLWKRGNVENTVPEKSISTNNTIVTEKCQSGCAKAANILQQIDSDVDNEEGFDIQDKASNSKWTHEATLLLLFLYKEKSQMLGKYKKMWLQIAKSMKEKKYNFTYSQCCSKMDALKRRYRQIIDHNSQSGNDRKEWTYTEPLNEIFSKQHWVKPLATAGSNVPEPANSPFSDNEEKLLVKRKRKSLNEEKVYYLKELVEEKKLRREETTKYRKEKLTLLKEIKEIIQAKK